MAGEFMSDEYFRARPWMFDNDPGKFWKLDISRSEPPVLATDQPDEVGTGETGKTVKSRSVAYRDEVVTNQLSVVELPPEEEMKAVQQRIQKNFPSLFDVDGKVRGVGRGKYLRILAMFLADVWAR